MFNGLCRSKRKLTQIVLISGMLVLTHIVAADISTEAIIKLYSEGKQVAQWKAVDQGRIDGTCFIFHIKKGARTPEVKICGGVYTVESVR
ncbi:MAG: hypothetical protein ACC653_13950 [Gammaproteobacteria bacterium]